MSNGGSTSGKGGAVGAQTYGANPYSNAAQSMTQAFNAMSGLGKQVAQQGGNAFLSAPTTAQTAQMQAATAGAQNTQGTNYQAAMQADPQAIASVMSRYQNPYEDQVVQSSADQVMRNLQQMQMQNGDAAIAAGAFGGGRHGLVEATTNSEALRNIGDLTGQLRSQGFTTAAGLAGQDIANAMGVSAANQGATNQQRQFGAANDFQANLANQQWQNQTSQFNAGQRQQAAANNQQQANMQNQFNAGQQQQNNQFNANQQTAAWNDYFNNAQSVLNNLANLGQASFGMGNSIAQQQQQQGGMAQQLMQQILSGGQQGFQDLVSQPEKLLQLRLASLGMNPLNNATTTTGTTQNNVGWGVGLGNLLGAAGNMFSFAPIKLGG